MTIQIPDFNKKKKIVIPDFEKEIKEIEVPKNSLERDFPGMTTSEIIETGGKGYTEEEKKKNIVIPDLSKQGFFKKALPITYKQIEYIWKEPLGLSEDNKKKVQKVIGDEDTLLGKFNNILVDSLSVGIDTTLRAGNTLDFGAGLGKGSKILKADSYEPFPKKGFEPTFTETSVIPNSSYDNIVSLNVLNVVKRYGRSYWRS